MIYNDMRHYIKYLNFKIIVIGIIALVSIILFVKLLNYENTLGFSLIVICNIIIIIIIGYTSLRYNYYRKINKLDKEVLESLK
jgi:hypothetical protein